MAGYPNTYPDEVIDAFLDRMAEGMPMTHIERLEGYPTRDCIFRKARRDPEFRERFDIAREQQMTCRYDEVDAALTAIRDGDIAPNSANAWVNAIKITSEKLAPRRFGARQAVEHSSPDGSMTPKPALDMSKLSTAALAELLSAADDTDRS